MNPTVIVTPAFKSRPVLPPKTLSGCLNGWTIDFEGKWYTTKKVDIDSMFVEREGYGRRLVFVDADARAYRGSTITLTYYLRINGAT